VGGSDPNMDKSIFFLFFLLNSSLIFMMYSIYQYNLRLSYLFETNFETSLLFV